MKGSFLKAALAVASLGLSYIVPAGSGSAQDDSAANLPFMPDLRLSDGSGIAFNLSRYKGFVIVLEFWSTSCNTCFRDLDYLNHLQGDFPGKPLIVIAVNEDPIAVPAVKAALARQKLTFLKPWGDPNGTAAQTLRLRGLPTSFVVDRMGRIVLQIEGQQNWNGAEYEKRINVLLNQTPQ
ncbi:MAG TPA: TlpA disulfide reductase family protein [Magnetospirillaceae bacterium]|nr:TlpA disulfide reductase family protein [Magnetospirillaceae bacterium]